MHRLEIAIVARRDLDDAAEYLHGESPELAERFLRAADATFAGILETPRKGRERMFAGRRGRNVRVLPVRGFPNYLVFYLVDRAVVRIVRVLHGARDIDSEFGRR